VRELIHDRIEGSTLPRCQELSRWLTMIGGGATMPPRGMFDLTTSQLPLEEPE
jgi:hypothetical protein